MNDNESNNPDAWARLAAAARARRAEACAPEAAPFGFATRVAARAMAARRGGSPVLTRLWLRGLALAGAAAVLALVAGAGSLRTLGEWADAPEVQILSQTPLL